MSALPKTRYATQLDRERAVSPFIPFSSHVSDNTIVTRQGDYVRTWRIPGIAFETADPDEMLRRKDQLNTLWRAIGNENVAVWAHTVRRRKSDRLKSHFKNDFCRQLDAKYFDSFEGYRMMANELYLSVVYRPNPARVERALLKSSRRSAAEILDDQRAAIRALDEVALSVEASLDRYGSDANNGIDVLEVYDDEHGVRCSEQLEFFNFLLSGYWQKVRVPTAPLYEYLGTSWIMAGHETITIRNPIATRYAQGIDFKDYTANTEPGMLNELMYSDYEFVMTQSFSFLQKRKGKDVLEKQRDQLRNAEDGSGTQILELDQAIDLLLQGDFVMGEYHYSLMVFGESIEEARFNASAAMRSIQDRGFLAAKIATATDAAYYAQLPGNWSYRPRIAFLTSKNFAGLSSFHNFRTGKRSNNPWGDAVTLFKTPSGQPLYFNFHFAKGDEDNYAKKLLGNTRVIGASGTGKTVLLNFCLCQSQKFDYKSPTGFSTVFLDKDEGAKITILAMGGKYLSIKNGQPTGLNPFQMEPTPENLLFLDQLVRKLVSTDGRPVSTADDARISAAVRAVMAPEIPRYMRRLSLVIQNMTEGGSADAVENSVVSRLARWCRDDGTGKAGAYWWVLDCPNDMLDFTTHDNYGIDGTDFLDNADVRSPLSMYLLHRMESVIDGRRFIYVMDESWKWVPDPSFGEFAGNKQLTIRKQNGLGVFATQMPSSLLNSPIAAALVQQVATEIYLPNPRADYLEYTQGFKLTDAEFDIVSKFDESSRMFLIKQGHQSAIGQLDLAGFDDELAVLSGSSDMNELLDAVMSEVGDDPAIWLPVFHERRKAIVSASKHQ